MQKSEPILRFHESENDLHKVRSRIGDGLASTRRQVVMPLIICWLILLHHSTASAFQNCHMQIRNNPKYLTITDNDEKFLSRITSNLPHKLRRHVDEFFISGASKVQFPQASIDDLIYTLREIERVDKNLLDERMIQFLVEIFTHPSHINSRFDLSMQSVERNLLNTLINRYSEFEMIISRNALGHNFFRWYGLCSNESPYAIFYDAAKIASEYDRNAKKLSRSSIRVLSVFNIFKKKMYFPSPFAPAIRYILEPCDINTNRVSLIDIRFNFLTKTWEKSSENPAVDGWYEGGYGDLVLKTSRNTLMNAKIFEELSDEVEMKFISDQENLNASIVMPEMPTATCSEK